MIFELNLECLPGRNGETPARTLTERRGSTMPRAREAAYRILGPGESELATGQEAGGHSGFNSEIMTRCTLVPQAPVERHEYRPMGDFDSRAFPPQRNIPGVKSAPQSFHRPGRESRCEQYSND